MSASASVSARIACRVSTLGHLLSEATGQADIVHGLSQFTPAKGDRENVSILKQLSRPSLEALALFLGIVDPGNKNFSNKEKLAMGVVRRFNQLVPAFCAECDEEYRVGRSVTPVLECHLCGRGAHDCENVSAAVLQQNLPGTLKHTVWLCNDCYHSAGEPTLPASGVITPASSVSRSRNNSLSESLIKDLQLKGSVSSDLQESASQLILATPVTATSATADNVGDSDTADLPEGDNREVCKAFLKWSCSHGLSGEKLVRGKKCAFKHLQVCKRFLKFGSSEKGCSDKQCDLHHPKLCKFVQTEKCCHNAQCELFHPFSYNKARRSAIKKKNAASKAKSAAPKKGPARKGGESDNTLPAGKHEDTPPSGVPRAEDFLQLQELLTQVLGRLAVVEKRLDPNPWHPLGSQLREPPAPQKIWPPPDLSYRFASQNAWC